MNPNSPKKHFPEGTRVALDIDMDDLKKDMRGTVQHYKKDRPTDAGIGVVFDGYEGISIGRHIKDENVSGGMKYELVIDNVTPLADHTTENQ